MRVVVTGATGNVGTSVLDALCSESEVDEIVGIARRRPERTYPRTTFISADIVEADLVPLLRRADALIHLAWLIQPGRAESVTHAVNVVGSERVFRAAVEAGVGSLVYASSVGAYSEGPKDRLVDETCPTNGTPSSFYARHKAATERALDRLEREQPSLRVVRMRPGLIFKREAARLGRHGPGRADDGLEPRPQRARLGAAHFLVRRARRGDRGHARGQRPRHAPLAARTSGPARAREVLTRLGGRI
jgi:nucleoside-diphosphate-sugar epimerase